MNPNIIKHSSRQECLSVAKDVNLEKFHKIDISIEYEKIIDKYSEKCKNKIQSKSPEGHRGRYKKGWTTKESKYKDEYGVVVYNATDYQLTHLLENGHLIVNKKNGTGWASAHPHIASGYRSVKNGFIKAIKNADFKVDAK